MKKNVLLAIFLIGFSGPVFAKPTFITGVKCSACHESNVGTKNNVSEKAKTMLKTNAAGDTGKCKACHLKGSKRELVTTEKAKAEAKQK